MGRRGCAFSPHPSRQGRILGVNPGIGVRPRGCTSAVPELARRPAHEVLDLFGEKQQSCDEHERDLDPAYVVREAVHVPEDTGRRGDGGDSRSSGIEDTRTGLP